MRLLIAVVLVLVALGLPLHAEDGYIWVEGENPINTNMKPHPWYAGAVNKADLSGGGFISNFGPEPGQATYQFDVTKAGTYTFWIRANPVGDPKLDYQLNSADWVPVNFENKVDLINIANDGKPDLRFIAWIEVGSVNLPAGQNTLSFKFHSANSNHGSLDCFVLTQVPFSPNGSVKPGQKLGSREIGWWSFEPQPETFNKNAWLDLRSLNEREAGESGFLQANGDFFRLGNGQPVRFWAVNASLSEEITHEQMDLMAARFAKLGINMVRLHGELFDRSGNDPEKLNTKRLDNLFYMVNALKKQGIYAYLSTYFVLWYQIKASDGIPGTEDIVGKNPFGLLFFEPRMQEIYKSWLKQILNTRSPYSGKTLAEESSVGIFEIQNEDSLFFWTFNPSKMGAGPRDLLEKQFGAWLIKKYGSMDTAFASWPGDKHPDDSSADSKAGFYGAFEMSSGGFPKQSLDRQKRILDQIHFLAQVQHDFYSDMRHYLRNDLGAKWPISASNWTTAPGLGFIERYTYSGVDVIDKHGYFGGKHEGDGAGWSVRPGQRYENKTAMYDPASVPFQYVRLPGHPHIQTEIAWNKPNRFIAEGEPLISAYSSLQGVDGIFFFVANSGNWDNSGGGNWTYMMPGEIGQSPAEALQYRRGDLKMGETILRQVTSVDDLLNLKSSNLIEGENGDFRMTQPQNSAQPDQSSSFDPFSFFVGRVERTLDATAQPIAKDLSNYIDRDKGIITSSTGEVKWDYRKGLVTVDSPRSQAVFGFLKAAGPVHLGSCTITSRNEYGAVHLISLDGLPISNSKRILIQAFTEEKMEGFRSQNGVIEEIGRAPIVVKDIDVTVELPEPNFHAMELDEQGYPRKEIPTSFESGISKITLPKNSLYTVITR